MSETKKTMARKPTQFPADGEGVTSGKPVTTNPKPRKTRTPRVLDPEEQAAVDALKAIRAAKKAAKPSAKLLAKIIDKYLPKLTPDDAGQLADHLAASGDV
jgi:hypothetical protein